MVVVAPGNKSPVGGAVQGVEHYAEWVELSAVPEEVGHYAEFSVMPEGVGHYAELSVVPEGVGDEREAVRQLEVRLLNRM